MLIVDYIRKIFGFKKRKFEAASRGKRLKRWASEYVTTPSTEIARDAHTLRARSRDLVNNNAHAGKAIDILQSNLVGTGIKANIMSLGSADATAIEALWLNWSRSKNLDYYGKLNFNALQSLAVRTQLIDGECFIIRKIENRQLKLVVLTADYLDYTKQQYDVNGAYIRQGIQFDENDRVEGYYFYQQLPGDILNTTYPDSQFYPAEDVIHLYTQDVPGRFRGVPKGVNCFVNLRELKDYRDAQLLGKKISAAFSVFVVGGAETAPANYEREELPLERIEPGMISYLGYDQQITMASPPQVEDYEDFVNTELRAIAAGFGVPYEALSGNYKDVNFSSGRLSLESIHRSYKSQQQNTIIPLLCQRIWEWFVEWQRLLNTRLPWDSVVASWTAPPPTMVDPVKQMEYYNKAIRNGLMSPQQAIIELGRDPEEVLQQISDWNQKTEDLEVILDSNPAYDARRVNFEGEEMEATVTGSTPQNQANE